MMGEEDEDEGTGREREWKRECLRITKEKEERRLGGGVRGRRQKIGGGEAADVGASRSCFKEWPRLLDRQTD